MTILERIDSPADLRNLSNDELKLLAKELRAFMIDSVQKTGGHLSSSLGVVELTIAILKTFPDLDNRIVWDVGHQSYAHKILTGRRRTFTSLRRLNGLAGFPKHSESPYDAFDTGHSSTSISAALGIAIAKSRKKEPGRVVAIIGDGALTSGLAFEGLNQAGYLNEDLIVIVNDNGMSIAPNVGALSRFMARALSGKAYQSFRRELGRLLKSLPAIGGDLLNLARRSEESIKALSTPGILFEALKFNYVGPVDGHDLPLLLESLDNLAKLPGPILMHVITQKGRGFSPAEKDPSHFHGIGADYYLEAPKTEAQPMRHPSYTDIFGQTLLDLAHKDSRIMGITAAMPEGTGLSTLARELPEQFIDVGIAEQHALTLAAGLASQGMRPVVAIYSTFMQRAFDQIVHDICMPDLPVVLALDRAGIVGEDGASHQGLFDISFLSCIPNLSLLAPSDENELQHMLFSALNHNGPVALRYPRGSGTGVELDKKYELLEWGKGKLLREGGDVLIIAAGNTLGFAQKAAEELADLGIQATVINPRFLKPLNEELICYWAQACGRVITTEENVAAGGFGASVLQALNARGILAPLEIIAINNVFVEHGAPQQLRDLHGLNAATVVARAKQLCPEKSA